MLYLITYELGDKEKNYSPLYDMLKTYPQWARYIDTAWIIRSEETSTEITDKILPHINETTDSFIVAPINLTDINGYLPEEAWDWIKEQDKSKGK